MDIARHGIYQPEHFYFAEIMCILLAVMLTDVVLLDVFNTMGMPTSTTVSMVFEPVSYTHLDVYKRQTVGTGVLDVITKDAGTLVYGSGTLQHGGEALTVEHVVAQNKACLLYTSWTCAVLYQTISASATLSSATRTRWKRLPA